MLYLGSLDDVVTRFPWTGQRQALGFNQTLLNNLLFGSPCLINDGYVVQSEQALAGIKRPGESSLIEVLVEEGFATILCRSDPRLMLEAMVSGGVTSHGSLANDPEVQAAMDVWSDKLESTGAFRQWPNADIGQGFYKLARLVHNAPRETLGLTALPEPLFRAIVGDFITAFEATPKAARTLWQQAATRHCDAIVNSQTKVTALAEAMNFANEIYHVNFAGILSGYWEDPVSLDTRLNPLFFWMLSDVEAFEVDDTPSSDAQAMPVAALPWGQIEVDISDGEVVARPFLTEGRDEFDARTAFLAARERLFAEPQDNSVRRDFQDAVDRYDKILSALFGVGKSSAEIAFETFVDPVAKAMDAQAKGPLVEWAEEIAPLLPGEPLAAGVMGLLQSAPFLTSYVSSRSLAVKRSLRSIGRFHPQGAMAGFGDDLMRKLAQDKAMAKDVMTGVTLNQKICGPLYSGLDPVV